LNYSQSECCNLSTRQIFSNDEEVSELHRETKSELV